MDRTGFPLLQPSEADPVALTTSQMRALRLWTKAIGTHPRGSRGRTFRRLHPRSSEVLGLHSGNAVAHLLLPLFCRSSTRTTPPLGSLLPSWSHPHPPRRGQTSDSISAAPAFISLHGHGLLVCTMGPGSQGEAGSSRSPCGPSTRPEQTIHVSDIEGRGGSLSTSPLAMGCLPRFPWTLPHP